jgi:hypothetical protein
MTIPTIFTFEKRYSLDKISNETDGDVKPSFS